jgi:pyrroline-5-carboxylate reductase
MENTYHFFGTSTLGIFGAGHLGRAIACGLLEAGFPRCKLTICHRGSIDTHRQLVESGLSECITDGKEVIGRSKIVLFTVRPQDYGALADYTIPSGTLLVSFLAGIPLERIPAPLVADRRARIMTSAPDTLRRKNGIAAIYPANNVVAQEIMAALKLRIFPLQYETDIHVFTALGPCLPIALTYWEGLGRRIDEKELLDTAAKFGLPGYSQILEWARAVQPRNLSTEECNRFIAHATTPGGVTEAILKGITEGQPLSAALELGIHRSLELAVL